MEKNYVIEGKNIVKKYKNFTLDMPSVAIPKGFATALIGENGAGKTTLLNILTGMNLDYDGELLYFDQFTDKDREDNPEIKERIGYTGTDRYYLPQWTIKQVDELSKLLFENYDSEKFKKLCSDLAIFGGHGYQPSKKISELSDGTKVKLMLAGVLARDTEMLIMDEPASPLDPLMRDKLCDLIREYLAENQGSSVLFSTHNISDMENVTDYAIIIEGGKIVEEGFVEDLKEKYVVVKGEAEDADKAAQILYTISRSRVGFEGMCLASDINKLSGMNVTKETPSLFQISVAVMKKNSLIK